MDAVKFLEERKRMFKNGKPVPDLDVDITYSSEEVVKIVEEWSAAHPRKTRQDVFMEQWPNALTRYDDGLPQTDPCDLDATTYKFDNCNMRRCAECRLEFWSQEVE